MKGVFLSVMDNHEMPADYRERITEQLRDLYNRINA
jgi:hypothetical protein